MDIYDISQSLLANIKRYQRAIEYLTLHFFYELPRGLDFSVRSMKKKISADGSLGYALTSKKALKNIMYGIPITAESSFIDVGSGKGGVPLFATELGFSKTFGIEYEKWLHEIAINNSRILSKEDKVTFIHVDALEYCDYKKHSHIFLFNPFNKELQIKFFHHLAQNLSNDIRFKDYFLILYGGISQFDIKDALENCYNCSYSLFKDEICPYRLNKIRVYHLKFG